MPQAFTIDDLYLHRKVMDLHANPSARAAVGTVRSVDREQDGYRSHLWLFPLDGSGSRPLTHGEGPDTSPRWAPDGRRVAFISGREGGTARLHLLDIADGGEARPIGQLPGSVSTLRWAPDGRSLLVTASVPVDPEWRGARGRDPAPRHAKSPEVVWRLPYKMDGSGYTLSREIHLFRVDAATGAHVQLTDGAFDVYGVDPSPDGRRIAWCRTRSGRFTHRTDLWVGDADGTSARQLTHTFATVLQPVWSPDGRCIAFAGTQAEGDAQYNLFVCDAETGRVDRAGDGDLEVADGETVHWTADGECLRFVRAFRGCHQVCSIRRDGSGLEVLVAGDRQLAALAVAGDELVFACDEPTAPSEVRVATAGQEGERPLTDLNPWWKERTPLVLERRQFEVPDGRGGTERIEGFLLRAKDAQKPYRLLSDVHGGPAAYALLDYDTNVFWHVLCSQGWAVLALNPVGSASYGRAFCERLQGHWGELDFPQHMAALQQLQAAGICDHRITVAGKSYGGYMAAWAVGRTDDFAAAVVMAPVGNIETHYGTSDGGYYADPLYVGSAPAFDRERARALSPLQAIERSATPVLFLQGKEDERTPKCQSEEMFVSLLRAGETPTEMVLYPGEDHHFLNQGAPSCRADASRRVIDWLSHWTRQPGRAPAGADSQQKKPHGESAIA